MTRKMVLVGALVAASWAGACNSVKVVPIDDPEVDASVIDSSTAADVVVTDAGLADADAELDADSTFDADADADLDADASP